MNKNNAKCMTIAANGFKVMKYIWKTNCCIVRMLLHRVLCISCICSKPLAIAMDTFEYEWNAVKNKLRNTILLYSRCMN